MQRYARNRHVYTLALLPLALSTWATPTFRPTPYSADPATTVLLHLDGDAVNDSPSHATVSAIGTAWSDDGIIGGALTCNGETKLSVMPGTTFARGFSVEAWLRPQRPMGPGKYVLVAHHGSFEAGLDVDPLGRCRPYLHVRTAVGRFAALTYDRLIFTRWAHVAFVYAPGVESGSALALYIHGRKVRSIKRPKEWIAHGDLTPGTGPLVLLTGLVGDVDEIRISDRPRRPEEFVCPWPSGRWGDFEPFRPAVVAQPAPDEWKPERVRFLAIEAVPTFRSISLYTPFAHDANANAECGVRYRVHGTEAWHRGMDLIRSTEEAEFRGSLLQLQPDTTYEIELTARDPDGAGVLPRLIQRTWSETLPIAEERVLSAGDVGEPLTIRARGQPDGWIRYAPPPGESTTIAVGADAPYAVRIEGAAFVVLERVTVRGGTEHGVLVTDSHDIRIRRCEVTGWGVAGTRNAVGLYVAPSGGTINCQDAIHLGLLTRRIVVEDNFIHTPCGTATCWRYGHPVGPQATTLGYNGSRNNVVRNNDIVGSEEHWYNDIIGSTGNGSPFGGPYRDTDIHGNFMSHSQDNAVELDGGQMNVRFWDNRMEYTYRSISFAPCIKGPGYAFFNLVAHPGDEFLRTGTAFKMGRHELNHGLNLIFFNTVVGRSGAGLPNRPEPYATSDRRVYAHNNLSARPGTFHDPSDPWHAPPVSGMFVFEDAPRADYRLRPGS
ncbi:MAG: hypothetical protein HON70_43595, partial [Lentisphaerae bacterium]|nr:hypothetical protein [Lentisphaerota bacterium]